MAEPVDGWADLRPEPVLRYNSLPEFVDRFAFLYRREVTNTTGRVWCPDWWRHPEAVARLEALWRSFEALRLDLAFGMSIWFRDHVDPHMAVLMDPDGPLKGCSVARGHAAFPVLPLPTTPPPDGWWEPGDEAL